MIVNDIVTIIEDSQEKNEGIDRIIKHNVGKTEWKFDKKMLKVVCVFKLVVEEMSCKEHE